MIDLWIAIYLGGWMLTTCGALAAAQALLEAIRPPKPQTFAYVSLVAGAVWPLLVVGFVEFGSLMTYAKLTHS